MKKHLLAIYGNKLSELDSQSTLSTLGAKFLKTAHTTANYRLFSTHNKTHNEEAMLCEDITNGRQIRVELWALAAEPLLELFNQQNSQQSSQVYLAKTQLSDKTDCFVFLNSLEHCLDLEYEDVSRFGGWERYLLKKAEHSS